MLRNTRTPQMIAAGLLIPLALLLPAGCIMIPAAGQSPVPSPQIGQSGPVTPLPSLCTSVEVHSSPSDAFRLKILVKNSAGEPAPGARVFITFYNGDEPVQIWTDDHGYAIFELHDKELTLPNPHGRTSGTLPFYITATWHKPDGGVEFLFTCASQEIDLLAPAEIAVTVNLPE